jgi:dipeptidyl aminopeptidase/acylaminoacyl peptidase
MNRAQPHLPRPLLQPLFAASWLAAASLFAGCSSNSPRESERAAAVQALAAAEGQVLTPHRVALLRSVASALISPDGTRVAYVLSVPRTPMVDEDGLPWSELHLLELASGTTRPLIAGRAEFSAPSWTPDGQALCFLAKRGDDKVNALYSLPLGGGEARRVAGLETSISAYSLSPDGKRAALLSTPAVSKERKAQEEKGFRQEVYEEELRPAGIWIAELGSSQEPRALALEGSVQQVRWSPVDERLLLAVAPSPLVDDEMMYQRVRVVDAASGALLARFENPGKLGQLAWSPDGAHVAMTAAADVNDPSAGRLLAAPAGGGALVDLLPGLAADVDAFAWQDAAHLMCVLSRGTHTSFERVALDPARPGKQIVAPQGPILTSLSLSRDGQRAAFVANSPAHPPELYTMSHGEAAPARRTDSNPALAGMRLAKQEVVRFAARDGLELEGILIRPLDEVAGRRYPLILVVHGGPEAHQSNGWLTGYANLGQMAAARGFAVFHVNYRGSTGRGVAFSKLGQADAAGKEFDDLVDAVDHLIGTGLVDRAKVGVTGGSYGGYATAWCSTRYSDRFAAGVMFVGISNKLSKVGTTDIPDEEFYVHALKRPWDAWQFFLERSPVYHTENARTPLLILHGKDDPRVNVGQSREMYRHLKMRGQAPVRLVLYPGEGHGNRKAAARLDYSLRAMQWFEHYLLGAGGEPPAPALDYADPAAR